MFEPQFTADMVGDKCELWMRLLSHLAQKKSAGLEIGSHEGRSALWFCEEILKDPGSFLVCVDPHAEDQDVQDRFLQNTERLRHRRRIRYYRQSSESYLRECRLLFDFIYVDGAHETRYVIADAVLGWMLLKEGGIMIFDDVVSTETSGPGKAFASVCHCFAGYVERLHWGYQAALRKIRH